VRPGGPTEWIPRLSVYRPVTVVTAFLVVVVVGLVAAARIPIQMMPSGFSPPRLWTWIPYEDSTPGDTEERVVKPLEEQFSTIPGLVHMDSESRSDNANLSLEFHGDTDMDEAYNAVADRIERAMPTLPSDIERVYTWRFDPSDEPVTWSGVEVPEAARGDAYFLFTKVVQQRIERIPGVARVEAWGMHEPVAWIDFDKERLASHQVDLPTLVGRLAADNIQVSSGRVEDRGQVRFVRGLARFSSLDELANYPVAEGLRLRDVADVRYAPVASTDINRINGNDGAGLAINKESSANTVEVCRDIRATLAELERDPRLQGWRFPMFFDQGVLIERSLASLVESALEGGALAVLVLILFLREWRITLLIAATIPATLLLTLAVMYFRGDSLNLLSMLGLMLAVGMVVDNAVVVVETIYRRRQGGEEPRSAAVRGTSEVLLPITLSTLTSIVVFLPMILMSTDKGFAFFMGALGLPVVFIQVGSLLVTLLFTPLSTAWLRADAKTEDARWVRWLTDCVDRGVAWVLARRSDAMVSVLAMIVLTMLLPAKAVGCSGEAEGNIGDITVRYQLPREFTYYERLDVVRSFERVAEDHRERWGIRAITSRLRGTGKHGRLTLYVDPDAAGSIPREEVLAELREALPDLPGVTHSIGWGDGPGGTQNRISVTISGEDTAVLERLADEARRRIASVQGVLSVHSEIDDEGLDEVRLQVRRDWLSRYGVSGELVGRAVAFAMRGAPLQPFLQGDNEVRMFARFGEADRESVDQLLDLHVGAPAADGGSVPLRALVQPEVGRSWRNIERRDRKTGLKLDLDLADGTAKDQAFAGVEGALSGMDWPIGYGMGRGSEWEDEAASDSARSFALVLSIVFVFLIMGVLFESLLLPLAVITTIPMAALGVYWGLWLTGTPFDAMAGVGMVILVGIVVNNGIVLLDVVGELRAEGRTRDEALREAVRRRLRPILMTALTAIVGVIPTAVGNDSFVGIPYAPLGRVVASGMIAATGLTLFFVPYMYAVLDDARAATDRFLGYVTRSPA
jgi:HAE1 family hydrophobic/amphiphilic exporter-1